MSTIAAVERQPSVLEPEDQARAGLYRLLAGFLSRPPGVEALTVGAGLLGDESELGRTLDRFAAACRSATPKSVSEDFQVLFIGLGRGELVPYASYYLTGFLQEKPLARLRGDMARLGLDRGAGSSEPEDHAAAILEMMAGLIDGTFGPQLTLDGQKLFFDQHIASWMGHFFNDLEKSPTSPLYQALGGVGTRFMMVEQEAFRMV